MDDTQNQTPGAAEPKSKKKLIIIVVAVLVLLFLAQSFLASLFSPERMMERALEDATGGAVDIDAEGDSIRVQGEDGSVIEVTGGGVAKLPDEWPRSVQLPAGAQIDYAGTVSADGGKSMNVTFTANESVENVTAFYARTFGENGWTVEANLVTGDGAMISATQGENAAVAYISKGDAGTSVALNVQVME